MASRNGLTPTETSSEQPQPRKRGRRPKSTDHKSTNSKPSETASADKDDDATIASLRRVKPHKRTYPSISICPSQAALEACISSSHN